jgi:hypothetical protein
MAFKPLLINGFRIYVTPTLVDGSEQLSDSTFIPWQNHPRPDIRQRQKDESALRDPGVGQNEVDIPLRQPVTVQEIEIDGSRAVAGMVVGASQDGLDLKEMLQELVRRKIGRNLQGGIEKRFGITSAIHGSRLINPRADDGVGARMQIEQFAPGSLEVKQARLDVGPEGDACSHKLVSR